jgi:hypothetical protein
MGCSKAFGWCLSRSHFEQRRLVILNLPDSRYSNIVEQLIVRPGFERMWLSVGLILDRLYGFLIVLTDTEAVIHLWDAAYGHGWYLFPRSIVAYAP